VGFSLFQFTVKFIGTEDFPDENFKISTLYADIFFLFAWNFIEIYSFPLLIEYYFLLSR